MKKSGFSLLELSVVFSIIALLIAVLTVTREILEDSEIKAVIVDIIEVRNAFSDFDERFDAFPGDFSKATTYLEQIDTDNNGSTDALVNGDGDEIIESSPDEISEVFVHLRASEYLRLEDNPDQYKIEAITNAYLKILNTQEITGYQDADITVMQIGNGSSAENALLIPRQAYDIDSKLDDSLPKSGKITFFIGGDVTDAGCTNTSSDYYLSSTAISCNLVIDVEI